jgi:folate-binding protein YgfZ
MLSNDVTSADRVDALLLTPKARLIAPVLVVRTDAEDFLVLTEPELGDTVRTTLLRSRFAAKCEIEPEEHTSTLVWRDEDGFADAREELDAEIAQNVDEHELERARIEAAIPLWGKELDDSILPAEAGLDETHISFTKGCYPGQEPIARQHYRGRVNRRLRLLEAESASPGDEIRLGGKVVGRVTSAVPGVALGYVRAEVPADADLEIGGGRGRIRPASGDDDR